MRNVFLGLIALISVSACNTDVKNESATDTSAVAVDSTMAPIISFEKESYEFGKIKQGESVSYSFKFVNTGKSPLIIKEASATCGCTVPEFSKEPIAAGASSEIKVTFNSAGKEGLQDKVVTLVANTIPQNTEVHLIGEVIK
ncbi:DUF1573 domain-containing protein [Pedobacter arcticus]|uniref:DUF1573 domain-containing protein n=1 Tax=Pedobacter arcticus TaxID=752140 RepID=UPI0002D2B04F|nr:DUF1573 domain-containing protein [Pedobacter arcticus]